VIYGLRDHIQRKEWGTRTWTSVESDEQADRQYEAILDQCCEPFFEGSQLAELVASS
jgi:hypothetical protein